MLPVASLWVSLGVLQERTFTGMPQSKIFDLLNNISQMGIRTQKPIRGTCKI